MEYVRVTFPSARDVFIDGASEPGGRTNATLTVNRGMHRFDLGEPADYTPSFRRPYVKDTTPICPMEVCFEQKKS